MLIAARDAILADDAALPYDAEVEYLESTGTQWIDTGLYGTQNTVADFRFQSVLPQNPSRGFGIFGARSGWANRQFYLSADKDYLKFVCGWGNNQSLGVCISDVGAQTLAWHTVHIAQTWSIDSFSATFQYYSFKTSNPLVVFQTWLSDTSLWYNESMKCSYLQIRESGELVLDFIPVRFTNEQGQTEGAMYDRVSGQLFRNAGTGAFVIGPDASASNGGGGGV